MSEAVADYVSCVRAQGAQLEQNDSQKLSAEAGYAGAHASTVSDVSASLSKKYSASEGATLEIIKACKDIQASAQQAGGPPAPNQPTDWVRQGPWGAIAGSDSSKEWGWSIERATEQDAINAAIAACGQADCRGIVSFQGTCGAAAKGDMAEWHWGRDTTREAAQERALAECMALTSNCESLVWSCSY